MIDATRRGILRMFGVTAAATAVAAVPTVADGEVTIGYKITRLPLDLKPPEGMTYNWKRMFVDSETPDLMHVAKLVAEGWKPVPRCRHCEDPDGAYWMEVGGLVLMEKPTADCAPPRAHPLPWEG